MESKDRLLFEISELVTKAFDKSISGEEFDRLQHLISTDPKALECYFDIISTYSCLDSIKAFDFRDNAIDQGEQFDLTETAASGSKVGDSSNVSLKGVDIEEFMADANKADSENSDKALDYLEILELERTSPAVVIEKEEPQEPPRELIQKVESDFKWFPGEGNKPLTLVLLTMAACFMVFIGYLHFFVPDYVPLPIVAELADSIDAVWDDEMEMPEEYGDMVQSRYRLKKGYASILFNSGAKVTVEAPAELSLNSVGDMELFSGKIYAVVPKRAHGFKVMAADNKIVDLGTEFGVELDGRGNTQLHVIKGKTLLYADAKNNYKAPVNVDAGAAKKVYSDGLVKDIPVVNNKFVREIKSESAIVWKGQPAGLTDPMGILTAATLSGNNPATGARWAAGDTYRLAFVTSGARDATSNNIADYNAFVQAAADAAGFSGARWKVIGSTKTVDARDNTSTNTSVDGTGVATFLMDGITKVSDNNADMWDSHIDASYFHEGEAIDHYGIFLDENGEMRTAQVFTGTQGNGVKHATRPLGNTNPADLRVRLGLSDFDRNDRWLVQSNAETYA